MKNRLSLTPLSCLVLSCIIGISGEAFALRANDGITSGPRGINPYVDSRLSKKSALTAMDQPSWSILTHSKSPSGIPDTLHIIAFMVDFNGGKSDTTDLTTGNGLFNIFNLNQGTKLDQDENRYYRADDTTYRYDNLDHYQRYFADQLEYAKRYFNRVSRGRQVIDFTVYPRAANTAYHVPKQMSYYSPGSKKPKESWDEYYYRKTKGLMQFVKDAVQAADASAGTGSPFDSLDTLVSGSHSKTGILIIHAGASYLTDGGADGSLGRNSPSDMIDLFISQDFLTYFKDTTHFDTTTDGRVGILAHGKNGKPILLDQLMMTSETSNQDKLNWGIHGIIINQIARQLGIPDLFSTSSGISAIGAFCIMDFAGYSAGQGFIPPYPSAWVRAYMGWDIPVVAELGKNKSYRIKAVGAADASGNDTTILLVPLNNHEYYLIENRQRDLTGAQKVLKHDTLDTPKREVFISPYPYNVKLPAVVTDSSGKDSGNVILDVFDHNYDVSLPASGIVIWHIDEDIIRNRLPYNMVNSDSLYRGVALVEADGINDLGITFQDIFYQAAFDYGNPEDVFPHTTIAENGTRFTVDSLSPRTRPSTKTNEGAQTFLKIKIDTTRSIGQNEMNLGRNFLVVNYTDTFFTITPTWDFCPPGWPKQVAPDSVFEPVVCNLPGRPGKKVVAVTKSGKVYAWPSDTNTTSSYGDSIAVFPLISLNDDTVKDSLNRIVFDSCHYLGSVNAPVSFPTAIGTKVFIPSASGSLAILGGTTSADLINIPIPAIPSTYICNFSGTRWAMGAKNGIVIFGDSTLIVDTAQLGDSTEVTAVAGFGNQKVAVIQASGRLSIVSYSLGSDTSIKVLNGIAPYSLVTGDLNPNDTADLNIIVCDSRQGLWAFTDSLSIAPGWLNEPNDIASGVYFDAIKGRSTLPYNASPPSLADINGDGCLDILVGGVNGIYAINYKAVPIGGWPYAGWPFFLDNKFWLQRGSITASPVIGRAANGSPLVLFSSPTGDNVTFVFTRIDSTSVNRTAIYFHHANGVRDSIEGLSSSLVDSMLMFNDSLVAPYVLPGGYIDAIGQDVRRPIAEYLSLPNTGKEPFSYWPLTMGSAMRTSPIITDLDNDNQTDLLAATTAGWIYRWEFPSSVIKLDTTCWRQAGFNNSRVFSYLSGPSLATASNSDPIRFYSYPNPTEGSSHAAFRYAFNNPASKVRIDIYTYTGYHVYEWRQDQSGSAANYPDWNEHIISLAKFGPVVYRCRIEATINGKKYSKFWKMAVVK